MAAPFDVGFDEAVGSGHGPVVLRSHDDLPAMNALGHNHYFALARQGLKPRHPPPSPHVTMLYGHRALSRRIAPPVRWTVRSFALVHSHVGRTGNRQTPIGST